MHMMLHYPHLIHELGCPKIFDMTHFEHVHGSQVKKPFKKTSARKRDLYGEIITHVENQKIIEDATLYNREKFNRHKVNEQKLKKKDMSYTTSSDIVYETTCGSKINQRIIFLPNNNFRLQNHEQMFKYLNPLITPNTFFDVLSNNISEIFNADLIEKLNLNNDDIKLSFVKSINIDTGPQGFPLTTLHCANNFNSTRNKRFDWIVLQDEMENSYYAQLVALLIMEIKDNPPTYLYVALKCTKVEKLKKARNYKGTLQHRNNYIPFEIVTYDVSKNGDLLFVCDTVDSIIAPAFVVPDTINLDSYFESNPKKRNNVTFQTIPMSFLFRDKYTNLKDTDELYGFVSTFDKASSSDKRKILESLIIKKNNTKEYENEDDPNDDEFNLINSAI